MPEWAYEVRIDETQVDDVVAKEETKVNADRQHERVKRGMLAREPCWNEMW
jgi:hypothetical protein